MARVAEPGNQNADLTPAAQYSIFSIRFVGFGGNLMVSAVGERRLAQWMLDVGTPPTQVFELVASTAGLARGARVIGETSARERARAAARAEDAAAFAFRSATPYALLDAM
jgi:hypothetical protein